MRALLPILLYCLLLAPLLTHAQPVRTEMVFVEGGKFRMGKRGQAAEYEKPRHCVKLPNFYIAKYETQWVNYEAFCRETGRHMPSDRGWGRDDRPVVHVNWLDAVEYCNWLSNKTRLQPCYTIKLVEGNYTVSCDFEANGYRLPTEAEWEYAARGGHLKTKRTPYAGSHDPAQVAVYHPLEDSLRKTQPTGSKRPNALGLHDMSGNVWEWCWDWFARDYYLLSPRKFPTGPESGTKRVVRGGSWFSQEKHIEVGIRAAEAPAHHNSNLGFRVVRSAR